MSSRRKTVAVGGVLAIWTIVSAWLVVAYTWHVRDWLVQTDEMLYEKLALSFWAGALRPEVNGELVPVYSVVYPLVLAPLFGPLSVPSALQAAHVLNAVAMASASVPAYLLARTVLTRGWSLVASLAAVVVPWMTLSGVLLTEAVAYPIFIWTVLALQRSLESPSPLRDLVALLATALAFLTRPQFAGLLLVWPLAVGLHEHAFTQGRGIARVRDSVARSARSHGLLVAVYGVAALGAAALALAGYRVSRVALGSYAVTAELAVLPSDAWKAAALHLDAVAVGCGLLPFVLGGAWIVSALVAPRDRRSHAFASLSLLLICVSTLEVASFYARFVGKAISDRYLFYVVPILVIAAAAAFRDRRRLRVRWFLVAALALTIFFAATVRWLPFPTFSGLTVASPIRSLNATLETLSGPLETADFVAVCGLVLAGAAIAAWLALPARLSGAAAFVSVLAFLLATTNLVIWQAVRMNSWSGRAFAEPPRLKLDWVDSALPPGETAAMIPFARQLDYSQNAVRWWDVEFWNKRATWTLVEHGRRYTYTTFPARRIAVDWDSGEIAGTDGAPEYVVADREDPRFRVAGSVRAARKRLDLIRVERPYRAHWVTRGLGSAGWTIPGKRAILRLFAPDATERRVRIVLRVRAASRPSRYRIAAGSGVQQGRLAPGSSVVKEVRTCIGAKGHADVVLAGDSQARLRHAWPERGRRRVGARFGPIRVYRDGDGCR